MHQQPSNGISLHFLYKKSLSKRIWFWAHTITLLTYVAKWYIKIIIHSCIYRVKKYYTDIAATGQLGKQCLLGHSEKFTDPSWHFYFSFPFFFFSSQQTWRNLKKPMKKFKNWVQKFDKSSGRGSYLIVKKFLICATVSQWRFVCCFFFKDYHKKIVLLSTMFKVVQRL